MNSDSFYSLDRLIEFGLGVSMAQQMIQMMNQSMKQVYIPGSVQSIATPVHQSIYVVLNQQPIGPLSEGEISCMIRDKRVTKDTLAWIPGQLGWKPIEQIPSILKIIAVTPPPVPSNI